MATEFAHEMSVQPLVEDSGTEGQPAAAAGARRLPRAALIAGSVAIALALLALASLAAPLGAPTNAAPLQASAAVNGTGLWGLGSSYTALQTCYGYTGGRCGAFVSCDASRKASCSGGRCVCSAGCSNEEGVCNKGVNNLPVKLAFRLANKKFPKYHMYMKTLSGTDILQVSKEYQVALYGKDQWNLYRLPNSDKFLIGNIHFTDYVVREAGTGVTALHRHGMYATSLKRNWHPDAMAVSVCFDKQHDALMIGSIDKTKWAYVPPGHWKVFAYKGDPGTEGLWIPEPSLTPAEKKHIPAC